MMQEEQFTAKVWNFHLAKDPWYKDILRKEMVNEIKSCKYIHSFLEVLCSSHSTSCCDDGVDVLQQIDSELLEIYLRYTTEDIECYIDPLYILIGAAGRHEDRHIFREEFLNNIHAFSGDIRLAVAEALCNIGDIENVKIMFEEDISGWVRDEIKDLLEELEIKI